VDVRIAVEPTDELSSLWDWLAHEPEFRARVRAVHPAPDAGQLGTAVDVLSVAVGAGGALTVLAGALQSWFKQLRKGEVRITVTEGDRTVEIDVRNIDDAAAVLRAALPYVERT
jgi:hypothetical protein